MQSHGVHITCVNTCLFDVGKIKLNIILSDFFCPVPLHPFCLHFTEQRDKVCMGGAPFTL